MTRWLLPLLLIVLLSPSAVAADELWIQNEGGLEVVVDGTVTSVDYDGMCAWNPDYAEGQAKVAAADIKDGWVVITGDITGYTIEIACGQDFEDVIPEVTQVIDYNGTRISFDPATQTREEVLAALELTGPPPAPPSMAEDVVATATSGNPDDGGKSISNMNAEKAIAEYNAWFPTLDWVEVD